MLNAATPVYRSIQKILGFVEPQECYKGTHTGLSRKALEASDIRCSFRPGKGVYASEMELTKST
jgi:hypothetical protein